MKRRLGSVLISMTAVLLSSGSGHANQAIEHLTETPVSLMTFGMFLLDDYISGHRGDFHPEWTEDDVLGSAHFDPLSNAIVININRTGELADDAQFERECLTVLTHLRTKGGFNVEDGRLFAHFDYSFYARFFQQVSQYDKRLAVLDESIVVRFTANLPGFRHAICSGPLLSTAYTISGFGGN